jgi:DNA polymerase III epsilon subunit-like protein
MLVVGFFIIFILVVIFIAVQLVHLTKKMVNSVKESPSTDQPSVILEKPFSSYTVFYIETTGEDAVRSSEITRLGALRVRERYEVDAFCAHVSPTGDIPDTAANANHFTESTVVSVPILKPALESFLEFIGNDLLVGYNIASFDLPLLQRCLSAELNKALNNPYVDLLQMAGEANLPVNDNTLAALAEYFKLPVDNVHDTLAHCHTTKKCFERLLKMVQPSVIHSADISTPEP